jgi:hypothetical protein
MIGSAAAAPVRWATNGHSYEWIISNDSWELALANAALLAPVGSKGTPYLATITSAAENAFAASIMPVGSRGWLAGSDAAEEGIWQWVAGPEAGQTFYVADVGTTGYANWNPGEPNNQNDEDFLEILSYSREPFQWNDIGPFAGVHNGYLVEWGAGAVPEPASWAMLVTGFGLAGAAARYRRRAIASAG